MSYCQGCADLQGEISRTADELAFWKYQAIWHRACLIAGTDSPDEADEDRAERDLEAARVQENRERTDAPSAHEIGSGRR